MVLSSLLTVEMLAAKIAADTVKVNMILYSRVFSSA